MKPVHADGFDISGRYGRSVEKVELLQTGQGNEMNETGGRE